MAIARREETQRQVRHQAIERRADQDSRKKCKCARVIAWERSGPENNGIPRNIQHVSRCDQSSGQRLRDPFPVERVENNPRVAYEGCDSNRNADCSPCRVLPATYRASCISGCHCGQCWTRRCVPRAMFPAGGKMSIPARPGAVALGDDPDGYPAVGHVLFGLGDGVRPEVED